MRAVAETVGVVVSTQQDMCVEVHVHGPHSSVSICNVVHVVATVCLLPVACDVPRDRDVGVLVRSCNRRLRCRLAGRH